MDSKTKNLLQTLADKYENPSFTQGDPSSFLTAFKNDIRKTEVLAFAAANLSFGRREQFLPKIEIIKENLDELLQGKKLESILNSKKCGEPIFSEDNKFYRFYSYRDINLLFERIRVILKEAESLGNYFEKAYRQDKKDLYEIISRNFPDCRIVSSGKNSAHKRINMFLRWMVRGPSPVDIGLWKWYPKEKLIIPLDTHVLAEAKELHLLEEKAKADLKSAKALTALMCQVFPGDPVKADYALFGLGIEKSKKQ